MTKSERIKAAREVAAGAAQALLTFDRDLATARAAADVAIKKSQALHKRAATVLIAFTGSIVRQPITMIGLGYGRPDDPKKLRTALEDGSQKLQANGGTTYSVKGLAAKMRVPSKPNLAAIDAALRREKRAQLAYQRATTARQEVERIAWDAGSKVDQATLVDAVVARYKITSKASSVHYSDDWKRRGLVDELERANTHLTATRSGEVCPCSTCENDRRRAEAVRVEAERVAALPVQTITCSTHGRKRLHVGTVRTFIDDTDAEKAGLKRGWIDAMPIAYCQGHGLLLVTTYKAALEKAAKDAARLAKAREKSARKMKVLPPPIVGDVIGFTCPGCGFVNEIAEVYGLDEDDDEPGVSCGSCGGEMLAAGVARFEVAQPVAA